MRKHKINKTSGITMISLIVTIIILLLLAGISIMMLTGDNGILNRAIQARKESEEKEIEEEVKILYLSALTQGKGQIAEENLRNELNSKFGQNGYTLSNDLKVVTIGDTVINLQQIENSFWIYNHTTNTVKKGNLELNVGDCINMAPYEVEKKQFNGKWRVLGEENGQLLLLSANYVDFEGSVLRNETPAMNLHTINGLQNEINRLNTLCSKYADDNKTENGRGIKIEDINRITGYDPLNSCIDKKDLTKKGLYQERYNDVGKYGNNITYIMTDDGIVGYKEESDTTEYKNGYYSVFSVLGMFESISEPTTIKSTAYSYYPDTLGTFPASQVAEGQELQGISSSSPAYDMLFNIPNNPYWIASDFVITRPGSADWGCFCVNTSSDTGFVNYVGIWSSYSHANSRNYGVRPVVQLKSEIIPTFKSTDQTTGISTYEI